MTVVTLKLKDVLPAAPGTDIWLVGVNELAPFASGPFVERYSTTILFPGSGALPNVKPSPKDNS